MSQLMPPPADHAAATDDANRIPEVRRIGYDAPVRWLGLAWHDLNRSGFAGVFYGALFAAMGLCMALIYETRWQLTMGMTAGFFLIAPFACCGIYWLSRQLERGEATDLVASMSCWKVNPASIGFFAAGLTFFMVIWARVSVVIFALFSTTDFPTLQSVLMQIFSFSNLPFIAVWFGTGLIFASIVFGIAVVSVPLMLDRNTDTMMAVFCSMRALYLNPGPLYLWAALIVALIGASLLLWFVPLLLTAPLVGHATWHAYRELVAQE